MKDVNENPYYIDLSENAAVFAPFKIKNGSMLSIGEKCKTMFPVDQHFNWFQKSMWKICFGINVQDHSEEKI